MAGCEVMSRRFFDPEHWKVILVDQRGCGKSTPIGCLVDNTTQALVEDFERLRQHLQLDRWLLFGGSWGSALSLAYAQAHPERVLGLILRGVCLMRPVEIRWMYGGGASALHPASWRAFLNHLPLPERADPLPAYYRRLTCEDRAVRDAAARAWLAWDMSAASALGRQEQLQVWDTRKAQWTSGTEPKALPRPRPGGRATVLLPASTPARPTAIGQGADSPEDPAAASSQPDGVASSGGSSCDSAAQGMGAGFCGGADEVSPWTVQAILECHYSIHHAFLEASPLLDGIDRIRHIPAIAVHGRLDLVCPIRTAYELHQAWPEMELQVVPQAGHMMYDPGIQQQLLKATDRMRALRPSISRTLQPW